MIVLENQRPPSTPSPTKNFKSEGDAQDEPGKKGPEIVESHAVNPRYPTLALRPVLLGYRAVPVPLGRMPWQCGSLPITTRKGSQRPYRVDYPDLYREPVHGPLKSRNPDGPRCLLKLVLLVLGPIGALCVFDALPDRACKPEGEEPAEDVRLPERRKAAA